MPAPALMLATDAGMSDASQCQYPDPVGASGSKHVIAKLFVPLGAPDHESCGDWFFPPQPVKTNSLAMVWPSEIDELVTVSGFSFFGDSGALTETVSKLEADAGIQTSR